MPDPDDMLAGLPVDPKPEGTKNVEHRNFTDDFLEQAHEKARQAAYKKMTDKQLLEELERARKIVHMDNLVISIEAELTRRMEKEKLRSQMENLK